jgi:aromatic ring hydroxylase
MGIRTGVEYRKRLRDGRTVYVNGERVTDVTTYPQGSDRQPKEENDEQLHTH